MDINKGADRMIWCVDDDQTIREIEVYTLEQMGHKARGFADGISMLETLKEEIPDLIILDIMMPGMDGIEVLRKLRSEINYKSIPVIMATAKGTEMDKIGGLNSGADDYLVKPFGVMEMVARVNAVLRRTAKETVSSDIVIGGIVMKEDAHKVLANGEKVELTHKEFEMLRIFMKNPNIVFSRDKLMNKVWGTDYIGESRTVDMHIKTLRKKLGNCGGQIKTVIGVGYRLENEV
jgi:two-component system alkaline phosphatase synthesis response regulator PhoP